MNAPSWICCQLGARQHYAAARALRLHQKFGTLITDVWVPPGNVFRLFRRSLRERFHRDLKTEHVCSATTRLLFFESAAWLGGCRDWDLITSRNRWFQRHAARSLCRLARNSNLAVPGASPTVFAYSYAALDILRWAKQQGWRTVLGQIDGGWAMGRIIREQTERRPAWQGAEAYPSERYWGTWREECRLADRIVVNSSWVRDALCAEGVRREKLEVIPLAFESAMLENEVKLPVPDRFDHKRPLRILMVGQMTLLKGVADVFDAARLLIDAPVEFTLVGPLSVTVPLEYTICQTSVVSARSRVPGPANSTRRQTCCFFQVTAMVLAWSSLKPWHRGCLWSPLRSVAMW